MLKRAPLLAIDLPLGKKVKYISEYDPSLLCSLPRSDLRRDIEIKGENLPFSGYDIWKAYELSWLNDMGKPFIARVILFFSCESLYIVESKSLKMYLNSFSQSKFASSKQVRETIASDMQRTTKSAVRVELTPTSDTLTKSPPSEEISLDNLEITTDCYRVTPSLLKTENGPEKEERLFSRLLKSNCPVTGQPDWAALFIHYVGQKINHKSLLRYIVSYRLHNEFHESCVERIFVDIKKICSPRKLTVFAAFARRGGIEIAPLRSDFANWKTEFSTLSSKRFF